MTVDTKVGVPLEAESLRVYFKRLVNLFFKILPMRENNEASLGTYMQSLQHELLGLRGFIPSMDRDSNYLALLAILQFLIDTPECDLEKVRREVFKAISICNKLQAQFLSEEGLE